MRRVASSGRLTSTEAVHPAADALDSRSAADLVRRLHREDGVAVRAVGRVQARIAAAAELYASCLRGGGRVFYVGAGTSGRLGALDAAECPPTFGSRPAQIQALIAGGPTALRRAVEGAEDDRGAGMAAVRRRCRAGDLVVGITASGRTPFVLGALEQARARGASTVLVCCARPPRGEPRPDVEIRIDTGPELIAGSTRLKAGTATKLVLNALSTVAMARLGKIYRGRMVDLRATNQKLRARALRTLRELSGLDEEAAQRLFDRAGGRVSVALAIHATGLSAPRAARALERDGLEALLRGRPDPK